MEQAIKAGTWQGAPTKPSKAPNHTRAKFARFEQLHGDLVAFLRVASDSSEDGTVAGNPIAGEFLGVLMTIGELDADQIAQVQEMMTTKNK